MNPVRKATRRLRAQLLEGADLIALFGALFLGQALVPLGHPLGSDALVPWMTLTMCGATTLRARSLGQGAHPMLHPRVDRLGALCRRVALGLSPALLAMIALAAWAPDSQRLAIAGFGALLVAALRARGQVHGETAWRPSRASTGLAWGGMASGAITGAALVGILWREGPPLDAAGRSLLFGLFFLVPSLLDADPEHLFQRRAAGQGALVPTTLALAATLGLVGPALSWWLLETLFRAMGGLDFTQAYAAALHGVVWAAALWPRREPVAMACLLHEVVPAGGQDASAPGAAQPFERPPEGTLRVNPLRTLRTRLLHPWMVPVRGARIARLDDPVRPLWSRPPSPLLAHVLGEARFEPDPVTRSPQREVLSVYPRWDADAGAAKTLGGDSAQSWSMLVIRAFAPPDAVAGRRRPTWRWEEALPEGTVQPIDPSTSKVELRDGDLLLVSAEGVAFGFELEIGAPVYDTSTLELRRTPQIEDYVAAGGA